jgi:hypothetical protein
MDPSAACIVDFIAANTVSPQAAVCAQHPLLVPVAVHTFLRPHHFSLPPLSAVCTHSIPQALKHQKHQPHKPGPTVVTTHTTPLPPLPTTPSTTTTSTSSSDATATPQQEGGAAAAAAAAGVEYDIVMAGGTLGLMVAAALQRRGYRVAVVEKRRAEGRTQEWNSSRGELEVRRGEVAVNGEGGLLAWLQPDLQHASMCMQLVNPKERTSSPFDLPSCSEHHASIGRFACMPLPPPPPHTHAYTNTQTHKRHTPT